jgi:Cytochrome P450
MSIFTLTLLILAYIIMRKLLYRGPPNGSIPLPGPSGLPLIGNALQFPAVKPWRKLKAWADEYGPIYQISALGKTFVVLGSEEVANDLLRARGGIYSDRHYIAVLRDEIHLPVVKYGGE